MDFILKGTDKQGNEIEITHLEDDLYVIKICNPKAITHYQMDFEDVKILMQFLKFTNNAGLD